MRFTLILLTCASFAHADAVLVRFIDNRFVREAVRLEPQHFTISSIEQRAREFLRRYSAMPFARLEMSIDEGAARYGEKGTSHVNEENYYYRLGKLFEHKSPGAASIASLVKIGRAALLRIRRHGQVTVVHLTPRHHLPGTKNGVEILHIEPMFSFDSVSGIEVFARTKDGGITKHRALQLAESISTLQPCLEVAVALRGDPWFITAPSFPWVYPFDHKIMYPTPERYRSGADAYAAVRGSKTGCR